MDCPKCGTKNTDGLLFCKKCGAGLNGGPDAAAVANRNTVRSLGGLSHNLNRSAVFKHYEEQTASVDNNSTRGNDVFDPFSLCLVRPNECAGVFRRFFAMTVDYLVVTFLIWLFRYLFNFSTPSFDSLQYADPYMLQQYLITEIIAVFLILAYFSLMECSPLQATLGKVIFKCTVKDLYGRRISFWRALARNIVKFILGPIINILILIILSPLLNLLSHISVYLGAFFILFVLFYFSYSLAIFTKKRQPLHDLTAGTVVVYRAWE